MRRGRVIAYQHALPRRRRGNPNPEPPNSTIHARRKTLAQAIQGIPRRIATVQTQVRSAAERARDVGASFAFSRLAKVQHQLTELARECEMAAREVWS